jgi:hypothetical protein
MMRADRTALPSLSVSVLLADAGACYDPSHHWISEVSGRLCCAVGFDAGDLSRGSIQGSPAAMRELAAALVQAADLADQTYPDRAPAAVEGVAG